MGGARTAIFNLLHARRHGGRFILRVEDTDVERSKQHHAGQILSSLAWMGIEWDEGPVFQSDRLDRYRERADELVAAGKAYRCVCTTAEIDEERAAAEGRGEGYRYSGRCRTRSIAPDEPSVIRLKVEPGPIEFSDLIRGDVRFESEVLDDFVLIRSDGNPTYHLAVVVDDIDMEVTVVARGDDHLSNTPKHILLFRAFDAVVPRFAHLPLILGADRKRLSKRTGSTSVEEYQQIGILPQALFNFLLLLGWAPGSDVEIISEADATKIFDLEDVNKAPAVFDLEKLMWLNGQYIQAMRAEQLEPHLRTFLPDGVANDELLLRLITMYQPRARTLREMAEQMAPYHASDDAIEYEAEAVRKHLKGDDLDRRLQELVALMRDVEVFDEITLEGRIRARAEEIGTSAAKMIHPLRLALLGRGASPGIFDVAVVLGRERCITRLQRMISTLPDLRRASESEG